MSMNKRPPLRRSAPVETENDGVIEGRNAVIEAREKGVVVVDADRRKLDGMSRTHSHQGVIALAAVREYATVDDILNAAREKGEPPLIVVCDELSDPHNLGAVIRTAAPPASPLWLPRPPPARWPMCPWPGWQTFPPC